MLKATILLHEGLHAGHDHFHPHAHGDDAALSPEQTLALLRYMLDHNRSHAEELHGVSHALEAQGLSDAARAVAEAVHFFDHGNEKLAEALRLTEVG